MHKANGKCAPRYRFVMRMIVSAHLMRPIVGAMTVSVKVHRTRSVPMAVKMYPIPAQPVEHIQTKSDEHDANGKFETAGNVFRH